MLTQTDIAIVKFSSVDNYQVAYFGVVGIDAIHTDVADFSIDDELTVIRHHGGGGDDLSSQGIADGLYIGEIDEIRLYLGVVLATGFIVGPNQVRAYAADLIENQVSAGERNRDNEDDRGVSDNQAEPGEKRPQPIGMQCF